jgi:hypothetical protein
MIYVTDNDGHVSRFDRCERLSPDKSGRYCFVAVQVPASLEKKQSGLLVIV